MKQAVTFHCIEESSPLRNGCPNLTLFQENKSIGKITDSMYGDVECLVSKKFSARKGQLV